MFQTLYIYAYNIYSVLKFSLHFADYVFKFGIGVHHHYIPEITFVLFF